MQQARQEAIDGAAERRERMPSSSEALLRHADGLKRVLRKIVARIPEDKRWMFRV